MLRDVLHLEYAGNLPHALMLRYIDKRRADGGRDTTIKRELRVFGGASKQGPSELVRYLSGRPGQTGRLEGIADKMAAVATSQNPPQILVRRGGIEPPTRGFSVRPISAVSSKKARRAGGKWGANGENAGCAAVLAGRLAAGAPESRLAFVRPDSASRAALRSRPLGLPRREVDRADRVKLLRLP